MMRHAAMGLMTALFCGSVVAETNWNWSGKGGDGLFSTVRNWEPETLPASDPADTRLTFPESLIGPTSFVNDLDDLKLRMLRLDTGLTRGLSFSGKPIAAQYIYDLGTSGTLTNTFENTLYAAKALAEISVPAGHTMIFNGPILMDPSPTVTNFCFNFTGPGTKIVNGGMTIDSIACHANYTSSYEPRFSAGTTIIRSDVTVPCMQVSNGAKLVITNGATVKLTAEQNSFFQDLTMEIANGRFIAGGNMLMAQDGSTCRRPVVNIRKNGAYVAAGNNRNANNGFPTYNVYDGGTLYWTAGNLAEWGWSHVHAYAGGRVLGGGEGTGAFNLTTYPTRGDTIKFPNVVNALFLHTNGTLRAGTLANKAKREWEYSSRLSYVVADGGTILMPVQTTFLTGSPDLIVTLVKEGGLTFNTDHAGRSVFNGVLRGNDGSVEAETGYQAYDAPKADGGIRKVGAAELSLTEKGTFAGPISVENGTLSWTDVANIPANALKLRTGGTLAFGSAAGETAAFASLESEKGVVKLVLGADGAAQKLTVSGVCSLDGGLGVIPVDANGAAFATPGTYVILSSPSLTAEDAAKCTVLNGSANAAYSFSVSGGALVLTVAAGASTPVAPADWADAPAPEILHVGGATIVSPTVPETPVMLDGTGSWTYSGAAAATMSPPIYVNSNAGKIKMAEEAGSLTIDAPVNWNSGSSVLNLFGGSVSPMILAGAGWMPTSKDGVSMRLESGLFELASDFMLTAGATAGQFAIGGLKESEAVGVTIDDGAKLSMVGFNVGPSQGVFFESSTVVTQKNAHVTVRSGNMSIAPGGTRSRVDYVQEDGVLEIAGASGWLKFPYGDTSFVLKGGRFSAPFVSFGETSSGTSRLDYDNRPAQSRILIAGGVFDVGQYFGWMSDYSNSRHNRVDLEGGVLRLPATSRAVLYNRLSSGTSGGGNATLRFDGGTLEMTGRADGAGASLDDYLHGVDSLVVAAGGATVVAPQEDVTVTQPVDPEISGAGSFEKRGAGKLTLSSTNRLFGAVRVREGTLSAGFDTTPRFRYPDGLLALWDFDGEDPYADRTGHGLALSQRDYEGTDLVTFVSENAHCGNAAKMTGNSALQIVYCNAISRKHYTVNLWVRPSVLKSSHQGFIASRSNIAESSLNYEFSMKMKSGTDQFIPLTKGATFKKDEWAMLTCVMDAINGTRKFYFNGEFLEGDNNPYQLVQSGFKLTIGMGINKGEFAAKGTLIDDVAIFGRPLSADEVKAMYESTLTSAQAQSANPTEIDVAEGATLDLQGSAVAVAKLSGAGTVANGSVTGVTELAVDPDRPMTVGTLTLAATGVVDCGRTEANPLARRQLMTLLSGTSVTMPEGAEWRVINTGIPPEKGEAYLRYDAANNRLQVETVGKGMLLIVR